MSDLISKSDVINILCNLHIDNIAVNDKRVTEYIRELPTVYDVEKVVEIVRVDCYTMGFDESQTEIIVEDIRKGGIYE